MYMYLSQSGEGRENPWLYITYMYVKLVLFFSVCLVTMADIDEEKRLLESTANEDELEVNEIELSVASEVTSGMLCCTSCTVACLC